MVGYARVSTKDQTLDLQLDALKKAGRTKIYTETVSGAQADPNDTVTGRTLTGRMGRRPVPASGTSSDPSHKISR